MLRAVGTVQPLIATGAQVALTHVNGPMNQGDGAGMEAVPRDDHL